MKKTLLIALISLSISGCQAHDQKDKKEIALADTVQNKPHVNWKVNKQFDEQGNLIRYDSTYTWSYTGATGINTVNAGSVMNAFKKQFDTQFPSLFRESFGNPIWNDSLFYRDFTGPHYFMHKWENNYFDMQKMMDKMDSFRNSFLNDNYPGLITKSQLEHSINYGQHL